MTGSVLGRSGPALGTNAAERSIPKRAPPPAGTGRCGAPASAATVASQSADMISSDETRPAGTWPTQRAMSGILMPPSYSERLRPRKGPGSPTELK